MADPGRSPKLEPIIEQLYREHADTLRAVAYGILRDLDDAEDAVQEVFRKLRHDLVIGIPTDERVAYLVAAVRNEALRIIGNMPPNTPLFEERLPGSVGVPAKLSHRFRHRLIRAGIAQALRSLSRRQRKAVWLTKLRDCSRREAAARLGIEPKALEKRLGAAYAKMRMVLRQKEIRGIDDVSSFLDGGGGRRICGLVHQGIHPAKEA